MYRDYPTWTVSMVGRILHADEFGVNYGPAVEVIGSTLADPQFVWGLLLLIGGPAEAPFLEDRGPVGFRKGLNNRCGFA